MTNDYLFQVHTGVLSEYFQDTSKYNNRNKILNKRGKELDIKVECQEDEDGALSTSTCKR